MLGEQQKRSRRELFGHRAALEHRVGRDWHVPLKVGHTVAGLQNHDSAIFDPDGASGRVTIKGAEDPVGFGLFGFRRLRLEGAGHEDQQDELARHIISLLGVWGRGPSTNVEREDRVIERLGLFAAGRHPDHRHRNATTFETTERVRKELRQQSGTIGENRSFPKPDWPRVSTNRGLATSGLTGTGPWF